MPIWNASTVAFFGRASPNQLPRDPSCLVADRESRNPVKYPQPSGTCGRIAHSGLIANDL